MNTNQRRLYNLLKEFDAICKENAIEYFLAGGVALGAVRNGGFLPWDDDVDIILTTKQYEKLDATMRETLPKDRKWITENTLSTYKNPVARYYETTSTCAYRSTIGAGTPNGFHLEIFIFDPFPSNPKQQSDYRKYLWLYTELRQNYYTAANINMPIDMVDEDLYYYYKKRLEKENEEKIIGEIKAKITYPDQECTAYCGRWSIMPYVIQKSWIYPVRYIKFEDIKIPVVNRILHHLVENYNENWNIIPTETKRKEHEQLILRNEPFSIHEKEIKEICEKENFSQKAEKLKDINMALYFKRRNMSENVALIKQSYLTCLARRLEKEFTPFNIKKPLANKALFREYFRIHERYEYNRFGLKVPINYELLKAMIMVLIFDNKIEDARKILQPYSDWNEYEYYMKILYHFTELKLSKYYEEENVVDEHLSFLCNLGFEKQKEVVRSMMWRKTRPDQIINYNESAKIKAAYKATKYRKDYEIRKYVGDLYFEIGDMDKAETYYKEALTQRNGMLIYDIEKRKDRLEEKNSVQPKQKSNKNKFFSAFKKMLTRRKEATTE